MRVGQSSDDESSDVTNNISSSYADAVNSICQSQNHHNDDGNGEHVAQFYVAKFDFTYVDTPLLVVVWVLFTAAVKIGQK